MSVYNFIKEALNICHRPAQTWLCYILLVLLFQPLQLTAATDPEYQLKAALLFKLTKFVSWPVEQTQQKPHPFGLCVLGDNPFDSILDKLQEQKIKGRKIKVHYYKNSNSIIEQCDLVFIARSKRAFLSSIIKKIAKKPILSISDIEDFAEKGGIIQFTSGKKIGFKINIEQSKNSNLKISAPLLQLAQIVGDVQK